LRNAIPKKDQFLAAFRVTASITLAAKACKCERGLHYRWLESPAYAAKFEDAKEEAAQTLEDEAVERATRGVFEPTVYQGEFTYPWIEKVDKETGEVTKKRSKTPVGTWKKSDAVLMFLLKGFKPDKYRERGSVEVTGAGGGPIEIVERLNAARKRRDETPAI
jgi:hypothetical protein